MLYSMVAAVDGSRPAIEFSIRPLFVSRSVGVSTGACFFFSSRRLNTRYWRDWSSDVCSTDLDEVRGTFKPIKTNVSGIEISELMPRLAQRADKYAIVRSVHHTQGSHNAGMYYSIVGRPYPVDRKSVA